MTRQLTKINAQISDILTKLEDFSDEIDLNILNNEQKLQFLDLNNQLFDLNLQKRREQSEINKQINSIVNKVFVSPPEINNSLENNNIYFSNKPKKWPTGIRKTLQNKLIDCLNNNGPQTSFQLAQNLSLKIPNIQRVILELKRKNLIKVINAARNKKNGSGELEIYSIC